MEVAVGRRVLVAVGAVGRSHAGDVLGELTPTLAAWQALRLIAEGCRREGLFEAIGAILARGSRIGRCTRLRFTRWPRSREARAAIIRVPSVGVLPGDAEDRLIGADNGRRWPFVGRAGRR